MDRRGKAQRCEGTVGLAQKPREGLVGCGCTGHCVSRGPSCLASRGFPGRGFLCAVPMATPLPRSGPSGPRWAGNARGDDQVLGAAAAAKLGKAVREAPCSASDAGTAREVSISLGNRNCCHGRSCIRKGCIPCLRKSLRLFLARGREESGLQLATGFLGQRCSLWALLQPRHAGAPRVSEVCNGGKRRGLLSKGVDQGLTAGERCTKATPAFLYLLVPYPLL